MLSWSPIQTISSFRFGARFMNNWPGEWYGSIILMSTSAQHAVLLAGSWVTDSFNSAVAGLLSVAVHPVGKRRSPNLGSGGQTILWQLVLRSGHPQPHRCRSTDVEVHPTQWSCSSVCQFQGPAQMLACLPAQVIFHSLTHPFTHLVRFAMKF